MLDPDAIIEEGPQPLEGAELRDVKLPRILLPEARFGLEGNATLAEGVSEMRQVLQMLKDLGVPESGMGSLIRATYHLLGLRTFFTTGEKETRAWTIHAGERAPAAAGATRPRRTA